ncbi:MAG: AAA family ATPase [Phaeodactylibacter xiamenensis]|uniref:Anticodon nuclease n=1 Tax=Phaeodactylibacter xiamenensis TaxID=1524460 RepID=A0A098SAC4_9BACT|nr:anticodon nuclease [Phaeodactylibacter xiamenensis]
MSKKRKIHNYKTLQKVAIRLRSDLNDHHFVLLYAHNGTGKTRLSMEFKDRAKKRRQDPGADTLYYNAFTEDLFHWNNDLENDSERHLIINSDSQFLQGFKELALEEKIFSFLERYAGFDFRINYDDWTISFNKGEETGIKISRGEENIFIWCIFLAIAELAIDDDGTGSYNFVRYIYIDDPISSLDDNNAIAVASDLAKLLRRGKDKIKFVISSHHSLFFNVMYNELRKLSNKCYFLNKDNDGGYNLQATDDTPFFHHVALLSELQKASDTNQINTYHFNILRSVLEKTAVFFGYSDFSACLTEFDDDLLYSRALNLLSHGKYSIYNPVEMNDDNKDLFKRMLKAFTDRYEFQIPEIFA